MQFAIIQITDDCVPLALYKVVRAPILTWCAESLRALGIEAVLPVCGKDHAEALLAGIPQDMRREAYSTAADAERALPEGAEVLYMDEPAVYAPEQAEISDEEDRAYAFTMEAHDRAVGGFITVSDTDGLPEFGLLLRCLRVEQLERRGVTVWNRDHCYVGPCVRIGAGTELLPGSILCGTTAIGENCVIGPDALLEDAKVGNGTRINSSQVYASSVGSYTEVGPFAYVRPGSCIGDHVKAGDFVEIKNSRIGNGTKISHLTYVGDSDVGERVNFGCGTVTVNYDRVHKYRTTIEDDAFIGCNTNLVAPVTVGKGGYTAAGSTITKDVPPQALAFARARQENVPNWAANHKLKENKK